MGICNPTSSIMSYRLDNEVGATLHVVEIDGSNYIQLVSKEGNILSQQPLQPLGGATLSEDFTPSVSIGGIVAGVTLPAGTSIEAIIKQLLSASNLYVGFTSGLSRTETAALSDDEVISYITNQLTEKSGETYSFIPKEVKGVFFILLKEDVSSLSAKLVSQGYEGLASNWSYEAITSVTGDWFIGENGVSKTVVINEDTYTMYGYYNNEWSTEETTTTGVPDILSITIS